ncbi:unnamed protein product [Dicrocoelium dendriticum]|nr:unnamed protein product [Dicrocoelium dendriticum]
MSKFIHTLSEVLILQWLVKRYTAKMSRLYDAVEPAVLDYNMLEEAVHSMCPSGVVGELAKREGIPLETVTELRLDFKNILHIDNLSPLKNLVKLQLDNNTIEQISGLDSLVNLKWLDLSFNKIERIAGLDHLVNLEDLSLFCNRIEKLDNLDSLKKLQVLSVGKNKLFDEADVIYLRRFPVLQSLCIRGNPLCDSEDYQYLLTAFLPNLIYIDYKRCDRSLRAQAYEKYQLRIDELNAQEQAERESERRSEELEAKKQLHQRAFVSDLDSDTIFQALYENDPEGRALLPVPEFSHTIETYPFARANLLSTHFDTLTQ